MLKINNPQQLLIWGVLLFLLAITARSYGGNADDAYWHVKVGEWILTHRQVPTTGIFSYTNFDKPWVPHEWLAAVLMYKVFQYSGLAGLVFLMLLCILISMLILLWFLLKRLSVVQSIIFVLFAYLLLAPHILPRPHMLAIPVMTYWTARLIDGSENQTLPPFYILPLMILWSNLHGSFVVGIAFSVFFAAEAIFYTTPVARKQAIQNWAIFVVATVICAAITPHGINGLLLPFQLNNQTFALDWVSEWLSPNFHVFQPLEIWLLSFLTLILFQGVKLPIFRLVFLIGLLHLSLKHLRHSSDLLSVLAPLILATPLSKQWHSTLEMTFSDVLPKTYKGILVLMLYFSGLFFYLANIKDIELDEFEQAQTVLKVLKPEQKNLGNVLNNYGTGDFLIALDYPTFIDTRAELYGDKFMKNYFDAIGLEESSKKLNDIISKYHVTWTLFWSYEPINTYLATQPQWRKIYADKIVTVYVFQSVKLSPQTLTALKMIEKQSLLLEQKKNAAKEGSTSKF